MERINTKDIILYKKNSSIKLSISVLKQRLQISIMKCLNPEVKDIKERKFDVENSIVFSLNYIEAIDLYKYITVCIKEYLKNKKVSKENIEFIHEKRVLNVSFKNNGFIITIIDNDLKKHISFGFNVSSSDLILFKNILKSFYEITPILCMFVSGYMRAVNKYNYDNIMNKNTENRNHVVDSSFSNDNNIDFLDGDTLEDELDENEEDI